MPFYFWVLRRIRGINKEIQWDLEGKMKLGNCPSFISIWGKMPSHLKNLEGWNTELPGGLYLAGQRNSPQQAYVACAVCEASHTLCREHIIAQRSHGSTVQPYSLKHVTSSCPVLVCLTSACTSTFSLYAWQTWLLGLLKSAWLPRKKDKPMASGSHRVLCIIHCT